MSKKLTKKQIERRKIKRQLKAMRQAHHEMCAQKKAARRKVIRGDGPRVVPERPSARTRQRQRRNGSDKRVGGR